LVFNLIRIDQFKIKELFLGGKFSEPLLYSFITSFKPLLDASSGLLSQGIQKCLGVVLSVYGGGFVCLWGWFCLFMGVVLSVWEC